VICGNRTYEEQDDLYAQGRSKPGSIVTKAKGGQSMHNFGTAFDIGIFSMDGKHYLGESPDYAKVGKIGKKLGLEWGGSWEFVDEPHFQLTVGRSLAELRTAFERTGDALA
jgi:peptidoglycan L-alanyl-D-glutamate endopeptidase CwlK